MSAIQFLREKAGVFVAVIIGISLLLFVVSDFFGSGTGQRKQMKEYYDLGEIAGEDVSYQDFEMRVQNMVEIYKLSGASNIDESTYESIREQVWQQMVREKILDNNYEKLGIGVSNEEVDDLVLGNNPHPVVMQLFSDQNTGEFNKSFLINFLQQIDVDETARKYWLFFEDQIVDDRMSTKYNNLVSKGLYITSKQTEFEDMLNKASVDFSFIMKNYASVPDSAVEIQRSELESYYSKHKNSYKRSALRDIEYVTFDILPSENDRRDAEEWINETKEEFAEASDPEQFINLTADTRHNGFYVPLNSVSEQLRDFVKSEDKNTVFGPYEEDGSFKIARLIDAANRPDSVRARHILISSGQLRTTENARHIADSLINLLKSGVDFEVLAMSNSDDGGSAQVGGDLGWFSEGMMVTPFNDACFSARKGEYVTAETTYGVHIIEVLNKSKDVRKYNIGIIDRMITPSSATNQAVYSEASQFAANSSTYEQFNSSIASLNMDKRVANDVMPSQKTLPGLDNPRSLVIALFSAKEGDIILDDNEQAVFEIGEKYVVAYCTRVQEEGLAPLKDVENDVRFAVLREKKADIISEQFKEIKGSGNSLNDIANEMGLNIQEATQISFRSYSVPGAGMEPALISAATSAPQGQLAGPVSGNNGVFMFQVNSVSEAPPEDTEMLRERLMATYRMRGTYEAYEALRESANIIDKRYKFY
ncbi:MAG TPA: SurA N-terminal domain-containing protein [Bacteroidales bacterium]|nr:SurA N-terminal domain-containing protein [Bacteroidales bacterium]